MAVSDLAPGQPSLGPLPAGVPGANQAQSDPAQQPLAPADALNQNLDTAIKAAPELKQTPGTAVAVAKQGGDVKGNAQAVAHVSNMVGVDKSFQHLATIHPSGVISGVFGWISHTADTGLHDVEHYGSDGLGAVAHAANWGLQEVQHSYRYLHDVEALHGRLAAILEIAGIVAGAVALGVATGGLGDVALAGLGAAEAGELGVGAAEAADVGVTAAEGAAGAGEAGAAAEGGGGALSQAAGAARAIGGKVIGTQARFAPYILGGEGAAQIEGRLGYQDSWARTADGTKYRDPHTGQPVSIGRDIASSLGLEGGAYSTVSGVGDAIGDMALDPAANAGSLVGVARGAQGLGGLGRLVAGGTAARNADDVSRIYRQYPSFRNAVAFMSTHTSGEILARFPELAGGSGEGKADEFLLSRLGKAASKEQVLGTLMEAVRTNELTQTGVLPTMTHSREALLGIRDLLAEAPGLGRPIRAARRLPVVFNPDTLHFSHTDFDPSDDYGARAVYQMLLMGETPSVARSVASAYLNTPIVGERLSIYRNAVVDTLAAMAKREGGDALSQEDYRQLGARVDELMQKARPGNGLFGMNEGRDISKVVDPETGRWHSVAITPNQIGRVSLPNFTAMKRAAAEIAGHKDLFGRTDDWLYDHVTQSMFKRFVLLTGGFALRVATSENIPNSLRLGVRNMLRGRVGVSSLEGNIMTRWIWRMTRAPFNSDRTAFDVDLGRLTSGYESYGGSAEHNLMDEIAGPKESVQRSLRRGYDSAPDRLKGTDEFSIYHSDSEQDSYLRAWQAELAENAASEPTAEAAHAYMQARKAGAEHGVAHQAAVKAAQDWLERQPKRWLDKFERSHFTSDETGGSTPTEDWANVMVSKMMGATTGADGTIHEHLIDRIDRGDVFGNARGRTGKKPYSGLLEDIARESRPDQIKGRVFVPDATGGLERLANVGFRRVLNPVINWMSREPLFETESYKQWQLLKPQVDAGLLSREQAVSLAASRATVKMMRFVHNLNERTQFSETVRNWMPFYFAQEQAYKRVFRLLAEEPGAFRRYQMMLAAVHHIGAQYTDSNGQNYFVYPGSGFMTAGTLAGLGHAGLPVMGSNTTSFSGNLSSAGVMFPFAEGVRPDVGPVIAIPVKAMQNLFAGRVPAIANAASAIEGPIAYQEPAWQQMIPNTFVSRAIEAFSGSSAAFNSSMMQQMQAMAMEGEVPPPNAGPVQMQDFMNRLRNGTKITFALRALMGLVTPISPSVRVNDFGLKSDLQAYISPKGLDVSTLGPKTQAWLKKHPNGTGDVFSAEQAFLHDYPDATPYTVFESTSNTGGFVADTLNAMTWVQANGGLVNSHPYAAAWLMPTQTAKGSYSTTAYNEEIAIGLRQRRTPQDFLNQLYVAAGDHQYYDIDRPAYYAALAEAAGYTTAEARKIGAMSLTSAQETKLKEMGGQTAQGISAEWSQYQASFQQQNPIWYANTGSNTTAARRQQTIAELQDIFSKGQAPDPGSTQTANIKQLLASYDEYHAAMVAGRSDSWRQYSSTALTESWQEYLQGIVQQAPSMQSIVTSVFMNAK